MSIYIVRTVEIMKHTINYQWFQFTLEDRVGKKISFRLSLDDHERCPDGAVFYAIIEPHFKMHKLIEFNPAYLLLGSCFNMAMFDFTPVETYDLETEQQIDAENLFNKNLGTRIAFRPTGERVFLPGSINLEGDACVPIIEESPLPHVKYKDIYTRGLRWDRRPTLFKILWEIFFPRKFKTDPS